MSLEFFESLVRFLGGLLAYAVLGILLYGIWRGMQRPAGRTSGNAAAWLRSPWFYWITSALFIGISALGWIPLPLVFSDTARTWMLLLGSLTLFPGLLFLLWGRLALGKNYFVSTGRGAQLFAGHQLVTRGPYAIVRHPMYVGLALGALGSLLVYTTWTSLLFALFAPLVTLRARREEAALAAEFGEQWRDYCQRVPAFFPRLRK